MTKRIPSSAPVHVGRRHVSSCQISKLVRENNLGQLITSLDDGIEAGIIQHLIDAFMATRTLVANLLEISDRSIQRLLKCDQARAVPRHIGERAIRLLQMREKAIEAFGNEEWAMAWLNEPNAAFSGRTPLAHARSELGRRHIETVLDRIDHGVFS